MNKYLNLKEKLNVTKVLSEAKEKERKRAEGSKLSTSVGDFKEEGRSVQVIKNASNKVTVQAP